MEGSVRTLSTTLPLNIDNHSEEIQQLYDMINRGRTVSESEMNCHSIDWIDVVPPTAFEDPILNWDIAIDGNIEEQVGMGLNGLLSVKHESTCSRNTYWDGDSDILAEIMELESAMDDALRDVNIERFIVQEEEAVDNLEQDAFRAINNYIREESSRNTEVKKFWEVGLLGILNDHQSGDGRSSGNVQQGTVFSSTDVNGRGRYETMISSSTDEDSQGEGQRMSEETSGDSYDSGQSDSSGSSSDDDYSSPEPDGYDWFPDPPMSPIVIEPDMSYTGDEAENEEVDIMNFTDERLEVLCVKTRPKMSVLENIINDHCYCTRVNDRSKPTQTSDSRKNTKYIPKYVSKYIPSPQKSKFSRPSNVDKHIQQRGQKNGVKCGRRKLSESSRAISNAKRNCRGRVLKNAIEKRQQLNHMERIRRGGLKSDFQRLRLIVPTTASNPKAPKDKILQSAVETIIHLEEDYKLYEETLARLTKEHNLLRKSLKQYTGSSSSSFKQSRQFM